MQITPFGITKNGETVRAYTLRCGKNSATLLDRGATLHALCIAGTDVVIGFDSIGAYERNDAYLGAVIGRYANRIAGGFTLGGIYYPLAANDTDHGVHLHGGVVGFDRKYSARSRMLRWTERERASGLRCFPKTGIRAIPAIFLFA